MAFKASNLIGVRKDLMVCCSGTIEFVGIAGVFLLIAGTLQMGSGVYFLMTLPVFSVASNIWTGVVSGLTGTVLTYFGCSDQARRRPYVLFTFCIVTIVANIANIVITQVGDQSLYSFGDEELTRKKMDVEKRITSKIGLWITTGATALSLLSAFVLAIYLFCVELVGRCIADKHSPLLKTISEEVLQKQSRLKKAKKDDISNRFFPPSRLIHSSKVDTPRLTQSGFWIPFFSMRRESSLYDGESLSGEHAFSGGGGFSLENFGSGGLVMGNYRETNSRNGIVNRGAAVDEESDFNDGGDSSYSFENLDARNLWKREDQQKFGTFKPKISKSALIRRQQLPEIRILTPEALEDSSPVQELQELDGPIPELQEVSRSTIELREVYRPTAEVESKNFTEKTLEDVTPILENHPDSWMLLLPDMFTNVMEISDFNEFVNSISTADCEKNVQYSIDNISERKICINNENLVHSSICEGNSQNIPSAFKNSPESEKVPNQSAESSNTVVTRSGKSTRHSTMRRRKLRRPKEVPPLPPSPNTTSQINSTAVSTTLTTE